MTDNITSLAEDLLGQLERDNQGNYLIMVYSELLGTYEWMPVTEEMVEILNLLEAQIHGERKNKKHRPNKY